MTARHLFAAGLFFLCLSVTAQATWVPTGRETPETLAWFGRQFIMPAAQLRLQKQDHIWWTMCCDHADRVKVRFVVKNDQYWGIPENGGAPFLLPADTIHPPDSDMPDQLAVEGVVMVVHKGEYGAPKDIVTCVWLPQVGG